MEGGNESVGLRDIGVVANADGVASEGYTRYCTRYRKSSVAGVMCTETKKSRRRQQYLTLFRAPYPIPAMFVKNAGSSEAPPWLRSLELLSRRIHWKLAFSIQLPVLEDYAAGEHSPANFAGKLYDLHRFGETEQVRHSIGTTIATVRRAAPRLTLSQPEAPAMLYARLQT
ncbi:hypothetical protein B0H17DRAFT_1142403 [Mycena rosella]|uniref:Uncharacterized protein n=1 Tax=Mycena rosella TaxID=1033263 RepID=A0AAD7CXW2_MYCRO|nr:hypothetical protein B0H17DRAFT_1142403 [Mycena rosella]